MEWNGADIVDRKVIEFIRLFRKANSPTSSATSTSTWKAVLRREAKWTCHSIHKRKKTDFQFTSSCPVEFPLIILRKHISEAWWLGQSRTARLCVNSTLRLLCVSTSGCVTFDVDWAESEEREREIGRTSGEGRGRMEGGRPLEAGRSTANSAVKWHIMNILQWTNTLCAIWQLNDNSVSRDVSVDILNNLRHRLGRRYCRRTRRREGHWMKAENNLFARIITDCDSNSSRHSGYSRIESDGIIDRLNGSG